MDCIVRLDFGGGFTSFRMVRLVCDILSFFFGKVDDDVSICFQLVALCGWEMKWNLRRNELIGDRYRILLVCFVGRFQNVYSRAGMELYYIEDVEVFLRLLCRATVS